MSTVCPNCKNPVRPNARFCGNCGATLLPSSAQQPKGQLPPAEIKQPLPPPQQAGPVHPPPLQVAPKTPATDNVNILTCPNCGTVARPGVKYCSKCGKPLPLAATPIPTPPPIQTQSKAKSLVTHFLNLKKAALKVRNPSSKAERAVLIALYSILGVLIIVGVVFVGVLIVDQLQQKDNPATTASVSGISPTASTTVAGTQQTLVITSTATNAMIYPYPAMSETGLPSEKTPTASNATSSVDFPPATSASIPPSTISISPDKLIFVEKFDSGSENRWDFWPSENTAQAQIVVGTGLELNGSSLDDVGATYKNSFILSPSLDITFTVSYLESSPGVIFNLDSGEGIRQTGSPDGIIFIRANSGAGVARFNVSGGQISCNTSALTSMGDHIYHIKIDNRTVSLWIDGDPQCTSLFSTQMIDYGGDIGKVSFSGNGLVKEIVVIKS